MQPSVFRYDEYCFTVFVSSIISFVFVNPILKLDTNWNTIVLQFFLGRWMEVGMLNMGYVPID